ncbi:MAG: proline dehydrogenase/delta-pyrroline-5-carboxylate dehydrogenase, partial [Actinomycetota bacterium]
LPSLDVFVAGDATRSAVAVARLADRVSGTSARFLDDAGAVRAARVRVIGTVTDAQLAEWYAAGVEVDAVPPVADAMVELRHWVREQAVSHTRHRHGRLLD